MACRTEALFACINNIVTINRRCLSLNSKLSDNYMEYSYPDDYCQNSSEVTGDVITITQTGIYYVWVQGKVLTTSKSGFCELSIVVNGTLYPLDYVSNNGAAYPTMAGSMILKMGAGTQLYHRIYQNGGYGEIATYRNLRLIKLKSY